MGEDILILDSGYTGRTFSSITEPSIVIGSLAAETQAFLSPATRFVSQQVLLEATTLHV